MTDWTDPRVDLSEVEPEITVLVVRDPDAPNTFTVEGAPLGGVRIIDVDLGYMDLDDQTECWDWAVSTLSNLRGADLPETSVVRREVESIVQRYCERHRMNVPTEEEIDNA